MELMGGARLALFVHAVLGLASASVGVGAGGVPLSGTAGLAGPMDCSTLTSFPVAAEQKNIGGACLNKMPLNVLKTMDPVFAGTVTEEMWGSLEGGHKEAVFEPDFFIRVLFLPGHWKSIAALLRASQGRDIKAAQLLAGSMYHPMLLSMLQDASEEDQRVLGRLLIDKVVASLSPDACKKMKPAILAGMPDDAFSGVSAPCLGAIPPATIKQAKPEHVRQIKAQAFNGITVEQAKAISTKPKLAEAVTEEQAASFGPDVELPQLASPEGGDNEVVIDNRKKMAQFRKRVARHPCKAADSLYKKLTNEAREALKQRCDPIINAASRTQATMVVLGAALLVTALLC